MKGENDCGDFQGDYSSSGRRKYREVRKKAKNLC